jgi:uncharacterized protein YegP (UPF0339 family)
MGKFLVSRRTNDEFQFNLLADNNEVILTSEGYTSRSGCENGIISVKENAVRDEAFDRSLSSNGKPYFNLKAKNSQVIGTSQMYESLTAMERGIESVMKNAPGAGIFG